MMRRLPVRQYQARPAVLDDAAPRAGRPMSLPYAALPPLFVLVDGFLIILSAVGADFLYHHWLYGSHSDMQLSLGIGLAAAVFFIAATHGRKLYGGIRTTSLYQHLEAAFTNWLLVFGGLGCILFLVKMGEAVSRGGLLVFFILGLTGLVGWRLFLKRLYLRLVVAGTVSGPRVAILVEAGRSDVAMQLQRFERYGHRVSRLFFLPDDRKPPEHTAVILDALIRHVREQHVDEILVLSSWGRFAGTEALQSALRMVPVPVKLIADPELARALACTSCDVGAARAIVLKPAALNWSQSFFKRTFDVIVSGLLLTLLAPFLAVIALMIRLDSHGPVFFRQWRGGYNGRKFRIYKFRTMHVQEETATIRQARRADPRVTRVGRVLRLTSIDELPQLINVLLGNMSLVGPRPHATAHDIAYANLIEPYPARHNVKPGITGWAQVNGCRGETAEIRQMQKRIDHDLSYIQQWSLLFDLRIILMTVREVLLPRNAH
jgi:Undecaprenyl-phosphate glucose phosphotransferase